jgi:FkbM family methyltransferase
MLSLRQEILSLAESPFVRRGARLFNRFVSSEKARRVQVGELAIYAQTFDRLLALQLLKWKLHEHAEAQFFKDVTKAGMCIIDIGANLGYYTLLAAKRVGEHGRVYAFEPDPDNYSLLARNIEANGCQNVRLSAKAVSNVSGKGTLFFCEEHRGDHRLSDPGGGRKRIAIETVRLDDALPERLQVDVIKMDIQGAEMEAVQGMQRILLENPHLKILCEFWPAGLAIGGSSGEEFLSWVASKGLNHAYIDKRGRAVPATTGRLIDLCGRDGYINLYLQR